MKVIINRSSTTLYTQCEVDAMMVKYNTVTGHELREAWRRYAKQYPGLPNVSEKQLTAILALVPAKKVDYRQK